MILVTNLVTNLVIIKFGDKIGETFGEKLVVTKFGDKIGAKIFDRSGDHPFGPDGGPAPVGSGQAT